MSKRRTASANTGSGSSSSKRIKFDNFGAANDTDDLPPAHAAAQQQRAASSAGVSTRPAPLAPAVMPSLVLLAARVFAIHFRKLFIPEDDTRPELGQAVRESLKNLPDTVTPKLLALLRAHCPTYISADLLILVCMPCITNRLSLKIFLITPAVLLKRSRYMPHRRISWRQCQSITCYWDSTRRRDCKLFGAEWAKKDQ
jgi:hypothetical protein